MLEDEQPFVRRIAAEFLGDVAAASDDLVVRKAAIVALGKAAGAADADRLVRLAAGAALGRVAEYPADKKETVAAPKRGVEKRVVTTITETERSGDLSVLPPTDGKDAASGSAPKSGTTFTAQPIGDPKGPNSK